MEQLDWSLKEDFPTQVERQAARKVGDFGVGWPISGSFQAKATL
jgi:hypothetical protein